MEDRKFVDIGHCTQMQVNSLMRPVQWFDLITVVPVSGPDIIEVLAENFSQKKLDCAMMLVREMSTKHNHLSNNYEYKNMVDRYRTNRYVAGVVSQSNDENDYGFKMTPGVSFETGTDNKGQQYRTIEDAMQTGTDIIIVGRGVYAKKTDEEKLAAVNRFRETAWSLYNYIII
jgi:orotidine-5'-phosphate decarboxylase